MKDKRVQATKEQAARNHRRALFALQHELTRLARLRGVQEAVPPDLFRDIRQLHLRLDKWLNDTDPQLQKCKEVGDESN